VKIGGVGDKREGGERGRCASSLFGGFCVVFISVVFLHPDRSESEGRDRDRS
jgi:hypothetical protein